MFVIYNIISECVCVLV